MRRRKLWDIPADAAERNALMKPTSVLFWTIGLVVMAALQGLPQSTALPGGAQALVAPLFATQKAWNQYVAPFNLLMPYESGQTSSHRALGCTSLAFAMILWHQEMQPHGCETYSWTDTNTGQSFSVMECFNYTFNWDLLKDCDAAWQAGTTITNEQAAEMALFCYTLAVIVGKKVAQDSGYTTSRAEQMTSLEAHFDCGTEQRCAKPPTGQAYSGGYPPCAGRNQDCDDVELLIVAELTKRRPLFLALQGCQTQGMQVGVCRHAMVIDGYGRVGDDFWVHIIRVGDNPGYWFDLWDTIFVPAINCPWGQVNGPSLCGAWCERDVVAVRPREPLVAPKPPVEFANVPYLLGTSYDKGIWSVLGGEASPPPGQRGDETEYLPPSAQLPFWTCSEGAQVVFDFAVVDPHTHQRIYDSTANITLVRMSEGAANTIVLLDFFSFDRADGRYRYRIDTTGLSPGFYDIYIATAYDAGAYKVRLKVVIPQ